MTPPYNPDAQCPKCQSEDVLSIHTTLWYLHNVSRIKRECQRCHYTWHELPADHDAETEHTYIRGRNWAETNRHYHDWLCKYLIEIDPESIHVSSNHPLVGARFLDNIEIEPDPVLTGDKVRVTKSGVAWIAEYKGESALYQDDKGRPGRLLQRFRRA